MATSRAPNTCRVPPHDGGAAIPAADLRAKLRPLLESRAPHGSFFAGAADALGIVDFAGTLRDANPAFARDVCAPRAELVGTRFLDRIFPEDRETVAEALEVLRDAGGEEVRFECRWATPEVRWVSFVATADRVLGRIFLCGRDISGVKRREDFHRKLLTSVMHDLRTPLTAAVAGLRLLEGGIVGKLTGRARELVEIAGRNCDRIAELIDRLSEIADVPPERQVLRLAPVPLGPLVRKAVAAAGALAERIGNTLVVEPPGPGVVVRVDPARLAPALADLLGYVVVTTSPGSGIAVQVQEARETARIVVRRGGAPLGPETFETPPEAAKGSFRLSALRALVDLMRGRIGFEEQALVLELPAATNGR